MLRTETILHDLLSMCSNSPPQQNVNISFELKCNIHAYKAPKLLKYVQKLKLNIIVWGRTADEFTTCTR